MWYNNDLLEKNSIYLLKIRESISTEEKKTIEKNIVSFMKDSFIYAPWLGKLPLLTAIAWDTVFANVHEKIGAGSDTSIPYGS